MENKEDDIADLFKERFSTDEAPVSPKVWQNIQNTLPPPATGILGLGAIKSIVLWSATIVFVSAAIGSYLYVAKDPATMSLTYLTSEKESLLSNTEKNTSFFVDSIKNKTADKKNLNDSSLNAVTTIGSEQSSSIHTSDYTINSKHDLSNTIPTNKQNNRVTKKEKTSSKNYSYSRETKSNEQIIPKENHSKIIVNKKSLASNKYNIKQGKNHFSSKTIVASNAIDKQSGKRQENEIATNKWVTKNSSSKHSKELILSDQQLESTRSANNNSTITTTDSSTNLPNIISKKAGTDKKKNVTINPDTIQQQSNAITVISTEDNPEKKMTAGLPSDKDQSNISSDLFSNKSLTSIDSSSSNTVSLLNVKAIESNNVSGDQLKIDEEHSALSLISIDSSVLITDSLSNTVLNSDANTDSALVALDSIPNIIKDSVLANAANKKEKSKLLNRLSFDLLATALSTGAVTKATDTLYQSAVEEKNKNDKNSFGYSVGIGVNYKLNERFHASAGIMYTSFSEEYNYNNQVHAYDSAVFISQVKDQYSFVAIPLNLSYTFLATEKIHLSAIVGFRSNILLNGVTHVRNSTNTGLIEVKSGFNSISFTYQAALEAAYKLNEHTALLLQPVFMYGASSIHSKASSLSQKPYGIGVTVGLRITF